MIPVLLINIGISIVIYLLIAFVLIAVNRKDLVRMKGELLLVVGTADESFVAEAFQPIFSEYCPDAEVHLLGGVSHMGLVVGDDIRPVLQEFMQ